MGTTKSRRIMLSRIFGSIEKAMIQYKIIDETKFVAFLGIDEGVSRKTALDYLKTLELGGKIIRTDGKIYTKEYFDSHEAELKEAEEHAAKEEKEVKD